MERSVSVNATSDTDEPPDWEEPLPYPAPDSPPAPSPSLENNQGPCLYLGPAGQRCGRGAVEGGFCLQHQPGSAVKIPSGRSVRRSVAIAAAFTALWPLLLDLIRELIRWFR